MKFELSLSVRLRNKLRELADSESITLFATAGKGKGKYRYLVDIVRELIPVLLPVMRMGVDADDDAYEITVKSKRKDDDTVLFDLDVKK